jgi:cytochrome P450
MHEEESVCMMSLAELDLPHLPMETPELARDPLPYFAAARAKHPWLAKCSFGYVVHEYSAIKDLLWMDGYTRGSYDGIVELMGAKGTPWGRFTEAQMLAHSGESHRRLRSVLQLKFTPRQANLNREIMQQVISKLLDEWLPKGKFDFEEFASYFPITVMCRMIGASPDVVPGIRKSLEALGLGFSMNPAHLPALQEAILVLDEFVQKLVAERRAGQRPSDNRDLLDDLIDAHREGGLTDRELYDILIFLFVAGYDTSKNVLTMMMNVLLDRPDVYARCAEDRAYCAKVVEETLRYDSPATIPRMTAKEIVFRNVVFPEGVMIFFPVSIAGRDPTAVEDPDRFDPEREQHNRHLAFGRGNHICLGQYIARAQLEEGLHIIAQRMKNPKRAGQSDWRPFFGVWGMRGLPIEFDAAASG